MYRRYLSDSFLNKFLTSWNLSSQNNSVVFVKATARSIAFYPCLKNENQWSIKKNILVHFWQIYQKPSTVFLKNLYLKNYGFSMRVLRLIHSYLTNRKERARLNGNYSF